MSGKDHPFWQWLDKATTLIALGFFLWMNASNFDETEIKTLLETAGVVAGFQLVKSKFTPREDTDDRAS